MTAGARVDDIPKDVQELLRSARRLEWAAAAWAAVALALWGWWFVSFEPLTAPHPLDDEPLSKGPIGVLALAVVPTVATAATFVYSRVLFHLAHLELGRSLRSR
ncbi:hypothetical protein [Streptomyces capillispiralis]|uniref:Uncharacterized protein n=1 Tax=Streptomyces capillispiralis TaxID=68182 RepID=A0A561TFF4_9ACTN|nr:hypothetical protein [Streptomyces capillispiralis]TWF85821.1 hypothetical protein FHX78_112774 [Streptomyces capillispiralis]GHH89758.1 hypothetical protein GCM10017779_02160 [Streptomyces capillispiralis]